MHKAMTDLNRCPARNHRLLPASAKNSTFSAVFLTRRASFLRHYAKQAKDFGHR